jgi:hypothetical protein
MKDKGKDFFRQWLRREAGWFGHLQREGVSCCSHFGKVLQARLFETHPDAFDLGLWGLCHCFRPSPFSLRRFFSLRASENYFCL